MAKGYSFDIVSKVDLQEVDNAINQAKKEILTRYDFKGSKSEICYDKTNQEISIIVDDDMKYEALIQILKGKIISRGIAIKSLVFHDKQNNIDGSIQQKITFHMSIPREEAKELVQIIKSLNLKVQPQIQDDLIRVSGKNKDDLQKLISHLKNIEDFSLPLQFVNYR